MLQCSTVKCYTLALHATLHYTLHYTTLHNTGVHHTLHCTLHLTLRQCTIHYSSPFRILSAAVIGLWPVLIIEVGTHWQQVKGIQSYLTVSGGSRSLGQTVLLKMSLCWCHTVHVSLLMSTVNITISKLISWFHFIDITLKILLCWCLFINVTILMSICWCHSINNNICEWATI